MNKKICAIILLSLPTLFCLGQSINDSSLLKYWSLELGYQNTRMLDRNTSPLIYTANTGSIGFQFRKIKDNKMWTINSAISIGSNQSKRFGKRTVNVFDPFNIYGNRDTTIYDLNPSLSFIHSKLSFSYQWRIGTKKAPLFLGGEIKDEFTYSALAGDVWFFNQLSLSPTFEIHLFEKKSSQITANFSLPLVSYILRQPYTLDPSLPIQSYFLANLKTGSSVVTINKFQQLNFKTGYNFTFKSEDKFGVSYQFIWLNVSNLEDRNLKLYSNSLLFSYTF